MANLPDFETTHLAELDTATIKSRSVSSVLLLISRSFVQRLISTIGFFLLSVYLGRPEIGLFIVLNDFVSILGYFSDVGLAASLIQRKQNITVADLRSTFTLQQSLVLVLVFLALLVSPWLFSHYTVSSDGQLLFFSLLIAFFLASLKTIPSVVLERQLKFNILAAVEVLENLIFYATAVLLAWLDFGLKAYAVAVLLRGIIGTFILYKTAPWPIGLNFSKTSLKSLLNFGLPYQINSLLAVAKDRFINLILWRSIGADGVGIIGWAQNWSQLPLRFVMDNVTKVTFPSLSRLQSQPEKLTQAIEKSIFFICLLSFPILGLMSVFTPVVINLIPQYDKWSVAVIPLIFYCFNSCLAAISTPLTSALNAIGKVKINTYLMIMWTTATWLITPFLASRFGYLGVGYATGLIALTSFVPVIVAKRYITFSLYNCAVKPAIGLAGLLITALVLRSLFPATLPNLIIMLVSSSLVYFLIILAVVGQQVILDVQQLLRSRKQT